MLIDEYKTLTNQAPDGIPKAVEDYYTSLAKFTWDCVARNIPMILSTDETKFDGAVHETGDGDGEDDDEGKDVSYVYPVLLTSNSYPREIALKGKVKVLKDTNSNSSKDASSSVTPKDVDSLPKIVSSSPKEINAVPKEINTVPKDVSKEGKIKSSQMKSSPSTSDDVV